MLCVCPRILSCDETKNLWWHLWDRLGQGPRAWGLPSLSGNSYKNKNVLILFWSCQEKRSV